MNTPSVASSESGRIWTRADLMASGLTPRQANRRTSRITQGIYAGLNPPLSVHIEAILTISGPEARICGVTSFRLAGVDLPSRLERDPRVWVQVPKTQRWPQRSEVRLIRSGRRDPGIILSGIRSLGLAYCWIQLANEANIDELVELADGLLRRQGASAARAELERAVLASSGVRGVAKARTALEFVAGGTDSIPETDPCAAEREGMAREDGD